MIRDITIGQYYPSDSPIHYLDPRVKLFATLLYIISLFLSKSFVVFAVAGVVLIACIVISKVPFRYMIKGLKPVWILLVFICIVNVFFGKGEALYFQWKFIHIYREGIMQAVVRVVRLVELILGSSLMTYTTTPTELTDGLEKAFHPLEKLHVPVHEFAMMMTIALRFVPTLLEETEKIMAAQKARGADMESGGLMQRIKALIPVLSPLYVSAFRRAFDLATAMESRCYHGGEGRTKMKVLHLSKDDYITLIVCVLYLAAFITANILLPAAIVR